MRKTETMPLLTSRCDLAGNEILRVCQHQITAKCVPMGSYKGGAGFKCLAVFTVLHYFGAPIFYVLIRFERQLHGLYRLKQRLGAKEEE
jgi:hypothetical protein